MRAIDIMTVSVVTVSPETSIAEAARIMMANRISGLPVVDGDDRLLGIVTEGDMLRRGEIFGERPWWTAPSAPSEERAGAYVKSHGQKVKDVMTRDVVTVDGNEPVDRVAMLLESHGIKRVPVVKDGRISGIISRANLLRTLAAGGVPAGKPQDSELRSAILTAISRDAGVRSELVDVTVSDGVAFLWGNVASEAEREAVRVTAENMRGISAVQNRIRIMPDGLVDYKPE
jgi:CBS-domain-containing membrane protein